METNNETFADAVAKLKAKFDCPTSSHQPENGEWCGLCREICDADGTNWCDRNRYLDDLLEVEEAHKREVENLKWKVENYAQVVVAKDAEIASLRSIVRELADKLWLRLPVGCRGEEACDRCGALSFDRCRNWAALIRKAREVCK